MPRLCELDRATRQVVRYQRQRCGELVHVDVKRQGRIPDGGGWRVLGGRVPRGMAAGKRNNQPYRHRVGGARSSSLGYDYLHIGVDDRSRIAYAEALPDERETTAAAFMTRAISWFAAHGITVERVMTDNGSCYRSREFAAVLTAHRVRHLRARPTGSTTSTAGSTPTTTTGHTWPTTQTCPCPRQ